MTRKFFSRENQGSIKVYADTRDGPCIATFCDKGAFDAFCAGVSAQGNSLFNLNTGQFDIGTVAELVA